MDESHQVPFSRLKKIAGNVLTNCISLKKKESLLVQFRTRRTDHNIDSGFMISQAFLRAALDMGSTANFIFAESVDDPNAAQDRLFNALSSSWAMHQSFRDFRSVVTKKKAEEIFANPPDVFMVVAGKGYMGKDVVGREVGYPIPGSRMKWNSALPVLEKFKWNIQSEFDRRKPLSRAALTYAMPLSKFANSTDIDYKALAQRTNRLFEIIDAAGVVHVEGTKSVTIHGKKHKTCMDFQVRRDWIEVDDGKCERPGDYVNIPAGEVYLTPKSCDGTYIADGSIHLDNSYIIRKPLLIEIKDGRYTNVQTDDPLLSAAVKRHFISSKKTLELLKNSKSTPKKLLRIYKGNFTRIGELGIGTNPKAVLSEFLIEAEKISGTVHIALGSGYAKGTDSVHHDDAVGGCVTPINVWAGKKQIIRKSRLIV